MNTRAFTGKTQTVGGAVSRQRMSVGATAAIRPPAYGIGFIDGGLPDIRVPARPGKPLLQPKRGPMPECRQLVEMPDEEETLQARFDCAALSPAPIQLTVNGASTLAEWKGHGDSKLAAYHDELPPMEKRVFEYLLRLPGDHRVGSPSDIDQLVDAASTDYFAALYRRSRYFQATQTAHVSSILSTGLDPARGGVGGASETRADAEEREAAIAESRGYVHLATRLARAQDYADKLMNPETEADAGSDADDEVKADAAAAAPEAKAAVGTPASILRVYLSAQQQRGLSVDLSSDDARKTATLIPPEHIRPYVPNEERLARAEHLQASHDTMLRSILSFDEHKLIPQERAHEVAARAFFKRRISFAGYGVTEQEEASDAKAEVREDTNENKDVESNPQPVDPRHLNQMRLLAESDPGSLLEDQFEQLSHSPRLLDWIYSRLSEVQMEKVSRALYGGRTALTGDAEERIKEIVPPPLQGDADSDWERAVSAKSDEGSDVDE